MNNVMGTGAGGSRQLGKQKCTGEVKLELAAEG